MKKEAIHNLANEILSTQVWIISDLFESSIAKTAMTAGELLFNTNQRSIKYAKGCIATTKRNDPKNGRWTFSVKCNQQGSKGPYDVRFSLVKGKGSKTQGILGREVRVSCNCNAWKYNGADFNALEKGYSERQYSNGQYPHVRDPQRRYLICKHIAACIPLFKRFLIPDEFKNPVQNPRLSPKQPIKPIVPVRKQQPIINPKKPNQKAPLIQRKTPLIKQPNKPLNGFEKTNPANNKGKGQI